MSDPALFGESPLAMTEAEVQRLTMPQRKARLDDLIAESKGLLSEAIAAHITDDNKKVAAVVILFSGGNDSTVLAHLFRRQATHAAHANTTIGIEQTRDFVRNACEEWGLPLIERTPPREQDHYRALVLDQGFPGPAMHFKMFQRLKERALAQVSRELNPTPYQSRTVFIAGRRRQESQRRANVPDMERRGSTVWVSPLVNWTKADLNTYRLHHSVPVNQVSDLIHMSGECLCGSFAAPGEREEIGYWFPDVFAEIESLEAELAKKIVENRAALMADARRLLRMAPIWRDDGAAHARLLALVAQRRREAQVPLIPRHRQTWGWGADPALKALDGKPSKTGLLCSSCDDRFQTALDLGDIA